ncbi:MAG TPA: Glu/Leu/Phe/Val dehydrogenase [Firmicutes bacterium]|nr:Glu/Leu/Phe/Val dehydrogenase [Bacillota bacterium]
MEIFEKMTTQGHEQVIFCYDAPSGLRAIIAIHDTTLGPALGGARMWPYQSEADALYDVLRLSRGMTYKNAAMGLNLGGGKSVIIGDARTEKTEELLRSFGRFVHSLGGRYLTAEDVGIGPEDMGLIRMETPHVVGLLEKSGDPSPVTAFGVYRGMQACAQFAWGEESLQGRTVAVQGLGHVGKNLVKRLAEEGAQLVVTDIDPERVQEIVQNYGARAVDPDEIYGVDCDFYAPCALGGTLNDDTVSQLKCRVVAGSANNQLVELQHGDVLRAKGIIYAPDFVINGGGAINVAGELEPDGYNRDVAFKRVELIYGKIMQVLETSEREGISTVQAANMMAEERIARIAKLKRTYLPDRRTIHRGSC